MQDQTMEKTPRVTKPEHNRQNGASLIVVMLILVVVSLLGVGSAQIALMSERGARNDRDQQVAWQAAEAALIDAEIDMIAPPPAPIPPATTSAFAARKALFDSKTESGFAVGCGTSGNSIGLCDITVSGKPAWLTADFTSTASSAPTTAFGTFTGRTFAAGGAGIQPARAPRYIIELVPDPLGTPSDPTYMYRVTAMGFGPRAEVQAVVQMLYRI
jgi:type IV pilus assembly protein PilX